MASANLDLVRSIYAAWERGDFSSAEWVHPEIEFVSADGFSQGASRGPAEMAERWRGWLSAWEEFRTEAEEYRELDSERVLVLAHFSGRGKTSGLEVGQMLAKGASLFHVRDGKVTRIVLYADRKRALADLGLAPEAGAESESDGGSAGRYAFGYEPGVQSYLQLHTVERCAEFVRPHLAAGMSLLDAGCGPGTITVGLARIVAPGRLVAVDASPDEVATTSAALLAAGFDNTHVEVADVLDLLCDWKRATRAVLSATFGSASRQPAALEG